MDCKILKFLLSTCASGRGLCETSAKLESTWALS